MATYILTWNPEKWPWPDKEYAEEVAITKSGKSFPSQWSCGNTRRIERGDRLFLLRQNTERGLIGAGYATSAARPGAHWDRSQKGKKALYVKFDSEMLLPVEQRLPIETLRAANLNVPWDNLVKSGCSVSEEDSPRLAKLWKDHLAGLGLRSLEQIHFPDELPSSKYVEGATQQVLVNSYERNPAARRDCIAHYGTCCVVCEFDFGQVYGEIGEGYIHVHHLKDLASIGAEYEVDPVKDMRPVCPNCHAMLHNMSAPTINELRALLKKPK